MPHVKFAAQRERERDRRACSRTNTLKKTERSAAMASVAVPPCSCLPAPSVTSSSASLLTPFSSRIMLRVYSISADIEEYRRHLSSTFSPSVPVRPSMAVSKRISRPFGCRVGFGSLDPSQSRIGTLSPELKEAVDKFVTENKVVLFMKGNRTFPQCGFSNTVVQILNSMNVPYETVNILEDDGLRQGLKEYSKWPTFPQLYIDGEFFGGCDITLEAFQNGQLKEVLEKAMCS